MNTKSFYDENNRVLLYMALEKSKKKEPLIQIPAVEILEKYHKKRRMNSKTNRPYYFFPLGGKLKKTYYISRTLGIKMRNLTPEEIREIFEKESSRYTSLIEPYPYIFGEIHKKKLHHFIKNENVEIINTTSEKEKMLCKKLLFASQIIVIEVEKIDELVKLLDEYDQFIGETVFDDYSDDIDRYIRAEDFIEGCISIVTMFSNMTSMGSLDFGFFELSEPYFNKTIYEYADLLCIGLFFYLDYLEKDNIVHQFLNSENINLKYTFIYMAYTLIIASDIKDNKFEAIKSYITLLQAFLVKDGFSVTKQFVENIKYCLQKEGEVNTQEELDFISKELVYIYDLRSREEHGNFDSIKNTYRNILNLYKNSEYDIIEEKKGASNNTLKDIIYYRLNYFLQIVCQYYIKNPEKLVMTKIAKMKNISVKLDTKLKEDVQQILKQYDVTIEEAFTLFLEEVKLAKCIPFRSKSKKEE